jgi:hypothetical protein
MNSMYRTPKFFRYYFGITTSCCFIEYGDPSLPSWSYWIIPGTWED